LGLVGWLDWRAMIKENVTTAPSGTGFFAERRLAMQGRRRA
jgi:hypothetical protein